MTVRAIEAVTVERKKEEEEAGEGAGCAKEDAYDQEGRPRAQAPI